MAATRTRSDAVAGVFDAKAARYDEDRMHRGLARAVAAFAALDGVRDVLDVATGTGLALRALADIAPGLALTGTDISRGMLEVARRESPAAEWLEADAASLPLDSDAFDLVLCVTGLHLLEDPVAAAQEWVRVLRPGGRIITATFAEGGFVPAPGAAFTVDHDAFRTAQHMSDFASRTGLTVSRHSIWCDSTPRMLLTELRLFSEGTSR